MRFLRALSPAGRVGLAGSLGLAVLALGGRVIAPYSEIAIAGRPLSPPSWHNLLGTNRYGQDVLSQLILGEILPNALPPVIVYASVVMAVAILLESALAFLRLSDPNVASWGNLIGLGRDVLRVQWYVSAIPGIAILVTVLAVSLVGQGLNDALNPRLKGR